jgi:predicted small integral membrane protein
MEATMIAITGAQPAAAAAQAAENNFVPSFRGGMLRTLALDVVLPLLAVQLLTRGFGFSDLMAVAVATVFPAASVVGTALRRGRVELIGVMVLVVLLGGLAAAFWMHDVRFILMRAVPGAALIGTACLVSLPTRAPLMFFVARQFTAGEDPQKIAAWNERFENSRGFRHAMRVMTAVWGLAFLAKAALWTVAALMLPTAAALLTGPAIGFGALGLLMAWTIAYARRGAARIAAGEE